MPVRFNWLYRVREATVTKNVENVHDVNVSSDFFHFTIAIYLDSTLFCFYPVVSFAVQNKTNIIMVMW